MNLARYRKAIVAVLGGAATVATAIPQESPMWRYAQIVIAIATAAGVFGVRNAPAPSQQVQRMPVADEVLEADRRERQSRIATERPPVPPPPDPGKPSRGR